MTNFNHPDQVKQPDAARHSQMRPDQISIGKGGPGSGG